MHAIHAATPPHYAPETDSRPGLTSLVRTGRGLMTVQTEIVGEPAQLVTIIDFRGRVLKTWRSPFSLRADELGAPEQIRRWHHDIETRVREKLAQVARGRPQVDASGVVAAHLFVAAMKAYGGRDLQTARALLRACDLLLPDDPRVGAALGRIEGDRRRR